MGTKPQYVNDSDIAQYTYDSEKSNIGKSSISSKVFIDNINGIFGIPYQFLSTADPRVQDTDVGAKYTEKIVARMPLLFLIPCEQKFMAEFDNEDKTTVAEALLDGGLNIGSNLNSLLAGQGKYYTAEFACGDYYKYVNTLCREMAQFLGVGDEKIKLPGSDSEIKISNINWASVKNNQFNDLFQIRSTNKTTSTNNTKKGSAFTNTISESQSVVFYLDGITSLSESFSNNSTESQLASTINGYSSQVKEIQFLMSNSKFSNVASSLGSTAEDIGSSIKDGLGDLTGGVIADLLSTGTSAVISGGKIVFPKIWEDSNFSRSYSLDIKLRSPDHDKLSIYLNIFVPYLHILALTLPVAHQTDGVVSENAYNSPMLVKAFCKGMFNIDMGLITSLSVTRGAECQWNDDGLPTQIDISIDIEDLYSNLYMTPTASSLTDSPFKKMLSNFTLKDAISVTKNTAMMDYLSNLAGLNIAEPEMFRRIKMIISLMKSQYSVDNLGVGIFTDAETAILNLTMQKLNNIFS